MPNASGSVDLSDLSNLSPEEEAALEGLAERNETTPPEPEVQNVLTAFLVVVGLDGNPQVMALNDPKINPLTGPTPDLIHGACGVIIKDIAAMENAQATAEVMQQQAMAMQQQMQEQMLQRQVAAGLSKPGGRN